MDWELDEAGNIRLCPLMGFDTAIAGETAILARLIYARSEDQLKTGGEKLQLVLTPNQALQLAEDLQKAAEKILSLPGTGAAN